MKDTHSHPEDKSMEDLFKTAFEGHKEPVDETGADQFMDQLENSGFFKEEKKKPFYPFFLGGFVLVVIGALLVYSMRSKNAETTETVVTPAPPTTTEATALPMPTTPDTENTTIQKSVERKPKSTTDPLTTAAVESKTEIEAVPPQEVVKIVVDTIPVPYKKTVKKDSLRVQYIMQVDTVKTVDSLTIKKRKWNRMKGKKQ